MGMFSRNEDLKKARGQIPYWAIAEKLYVSESTLYRWIRSELTPERKEDIFKAIEAAKEELAKVN